MSVDSDDDMLCGTCFHFMPDQHEDHGGPEGQCMRFPPQLVVLRGMDGVDRPQSHFPRLDENHVPCGEWWPLEAPWMAPSSIDLAAEAEKATPMEIGGLARPPKPDPDPNKH